jgi:hypothetical protein
MCIDATRQVQILKGEIGLSKDDIIELLLRKKRECEMTLIEAIRKDMASGRRPDVRQLVWSE